MKLGPEGKSGNGAAGAVLAAVGLKWFRPLIYNLGGRKMAVSAAGLTLIKTIVDGGTLDWPRAVACLAVALVAVGTSLAIGMEDNKKEAKKP
jgi:hypothetical protein